MFIIIIIFSASNNSGHTGAVTFDALIFTIIRPSLSFAFIFISIFIFSHLYHIVNGHPIAVNHCVNDERRLWVKVPFERILPKDHEIVGGDNSLFRPTLGPSRSFRFVVSLISVVLHILLETSVHIGVHFSIIRQTL